jgi:DNA-binding NarL/FixJ family response regulator
MIRVVVVASALAVRAGLSALLSPDQGVEVIGAAAQLSDLVELPPQTDVLVLEAEQADRPELERLAYAPEPVAVLLLFTGDAGTVRLLSGLPLRSWGLLPLESSTEELLAALNAVQEGLLVGAPALKEPLLAAYFAIAERPDVGSNQPAGPSQDEPLVEPLTERESEVLQLLAQGLANKQIARALGISEHTVKFHVSAVYAKLGAASRTEAVRLGARQGLVVL